MRTSRVISVKINTLDLLSVKELTQYPGENLGPEHFDSHVLVALAGERTRMFYLRDGASQDFGPVEVGTDEYAAPFEVKDFDFFHLNAENHLLDLLKQIVREEISDELVQLAEDRAEIAAGEEELARGESISLGELKKRLR